MSTLAALANPGAGELQENINKYKEESEKEDVNEVRPTSFLPLSFLRATAEHQLIGSGGSTSTQSRGRGGRERGIRSGVDFACSDGEGHLGRVED